LDFIAKPKQSTTIGDKYSKTAGDIRELWISKDDNKLFNQHGDYTNKMSIP